MWLSLASYNITSDNRHVSMSNKFLSVVDSMLPVVPEQGTVGASGDLAPLSHLALGIVLGEGKMWSPKSGLSDAHLVSLSY